MSSSDWLRWKHKFQSILRYQSVVPIPRAWLRNMPFVPREGMRYSKFPSHKFGAVLIGCVCFCSTSYMFDMFVEKRRIQMDIDIGDLHNAPLTEPLGVWDQHVKQGLPMRKNNSLFNSEIGLTRETMRPIMGVEDVEGAPIWSPYVKDTIVPFDPADHERLVRESITDPSGWPRFKIVNKELEVPYVDPHQDQEYSENTAKYSEVIKKTRKY